MDAASGRGCSGAVRHCVTPWGVLQAHAWVALGKFCLVDEATAKKCMPLFVQELGRATNPAVRTQPLLLLGFHSWLCWTHRGHLLHN